MNVDVGKGTEKTVRSGMKKNAKRRNAIRERVKKDK